jgi:exodeoxyribonuclease VII small subunit
MARKEGVDMSKQSASHADIAAMSFEQAIKELEQIVGKLERGDVELEPSIELYERGEALRAHCDQLLRRIEAKVEKITLDAQGANGSVPLDTN